MNKKIGIPIMVMTIVPWVTVLKLMGVSFYGQLSGLGVQCVGLLLIIIFKKRIWP